MNNLLRKKLFDNRGILIQENDTIKISNTTTGGGILLKAKYDEEGQRWLFYNDVVPYTWEDLQLSQVKSILVVSDEHKRE